MKTYKFKTNINCGGCIATVKPYLDKAEGVNAWEVDTTHKDKILSVETTEYINEEKIQNVVASAGFKADPMHTSHFKKLFG
jgi:copper chaperone CopZ